MSLNKEQTKFQISVSAISTRPKIFLDSIKDLERLGVNRIHVDVMDGHFVPRLGMFPEFIENIRELTKLPIDIHLMAIEPQKFIDVIFKAGATRITPHLESTKQIRDLIWQIREHGIEAGIAVNPGTDIEALKNVLPDVSSTTIMAINPGIKGHSFIESTFVRIQNFLKMRRDVNPSIELEIDGGVVFSNIKKLNLAGADIAVCGAGTIFHPQNSIEANFQQIQNLMA